MYAMMYDNNKHMSVLVMGSLCERFEAQYSRKSYFPSYDLEGKVDL